MEEKDFFFTLYRQARFLEKNVQLKRFLEAAVLVTQDFMGVELTPLQKHYLTVSVGAAYCHYGLSLFSTLSLALLEDGLAQVCGQSGSFIKKYLLNLKDFLINDTFIANKDELFDANKLYDIFCHEFLKRIFCSSQEDDAEIGLSFFSSNTLVFFRKMARKGIDNAISFDEFNNALERNFSDPDDIEKIWEHFVTFISVLKTDIFSLVMWRFESSVTFLQMKENPILIYKNQQNMENEKSKKITALLLLLGFFQGNSERKEQKNIQIPLTASQIFKILVLEMKSEEPTKNWWNDIGRWLGMNVWFPLPNDANGGVNVSFNDIKPALNTSLEEGVGMEIFFKTPHQLKTYAYGLTERGLKIAKSYDFLRCG